MQSFAHLLRDSDRDNFYLWCMGYNPSTKHMPGGPFFRKDFNPDTDVLEQIEEVTLHVQQAWAVTDHNANVAAAFPKTVLDGTTPNVVLRTQDPDFSKGNKLPGDMAIMIFAAAAKLNLTGIPIATQTTVQKADTQQTMDSSVLQAYQGGARLFEVVGEEFMDYGPSLLTGGFDATNTSIQPTAPRIMRALNAPRILGNEQTLQIYQQVNRTTDWASTFNVDYYFPALIGRRR